MRRSLSHGRFVLLLVPLVTLAFLSAGCESGDGAGAADAGPTGDIVPGDGSGDGLRDAPIGPGDGDDLRGPDAPGDSASDATRDVVDGAHQDALPSDAPTPEDAAPPGDVPIAIPCEPGALIGPSFDLLPAGTPRPQIHPDLAFDGHAVWLVWNQLTPGSSAFDVWATRLACDGGVSVPPFRVQAVDDGNDIDPAVAAADGTVAVVWATDTGGDPNLFVRWRTFDLGGVPRMAREATLQPRLAGEPVDAGAWMVDVATRPGAEFAVAGSWGAPEVERFQAFVQRFDAEGEPTGAFVTGPAEAEVSHLRPSVAGADDGWFVAWTREPDRGAKRAMVARLPTGADALEAPLAATPEQAGLSSQLPAVAAAPGPDTPAWLAFTQQRVTVGGALLDVVVRDVRAGASEDAASLVFGTERAQDHTPVLAAAADGSGGVIVWYRTRQGIYNDVLAQRFHVAEGALVADDEPEVLNPPDADGEHGAPSVYTPTVVALPDGVYLVAWSEGLSPDFTVRGHFLAP